MGWALNQSSTMETHVIPNDNILDLLWLPWLPFLLKNVIEQLIWKLKELCRVVWTQFGMAVEDATIADGCAYGGFASPLARNLCDRTVTKDVAPSFAPFCQVEPCLIKMYSCGSAMASSSKILYRSKKMYNTNKILQYKYSTVLMCRRDRPYSIRCKNSVLYISYLHILESLLLNSV